MDDTPETGRRIRLNGERFRGGRLPVDSLIELQRYQKLVRAFAEARWQAEHSSQQVPAELLDDVSLTIAHIDEGSADIFLVFEQHAAYVELQQEAEKAANNTIGAAYAGDDRIVLPPGLTEKLRVEVAEIGSTLDENQSIEFFVDGADEPPVVITVESRVQARERLELNDFFLVDIEGPENNALVKMEESVVGRITEIDAENKRFRMDSLLYGPLGGFYRKNPELLEDFRKVVDESASGPVTRVAGEMQYRGGKPWRLWDATLVERFEVDNVGWGSDLIALGSLPAGWGDGGDGVPITFAALDAAKAILQAITQARLEEPGVFPTTRGGLLLEWSSTEEVHSIEISPDAAFDLFSLPAGSFESRSRSVRVLTEAVQFATGVTR